jgi:hypothetical protein
MGTVVPFPTLPRRPEVIPLADARAFWVAAPMPWCNARVVVLANKVWGVCRYLDTRSGKLVVEHSFDGRPVFRSYRPAELRHPTDRGPSAA